jgi:hypothetical protein
METIDRSRISSYREAARRARAEYVHCLFARLIARLAGGFRPRPAPVRVAPCGG